MGLCQNSFLDADETDWADFLFYDTQQVIIYPLYPLNLRLKNNDV